MHSKNQFFSY